MAFQRHGGRRLQDMNPAFGRWADIEAGMLPCPRLRALKSIGGGAWINSCR